jgi:hypothetical protein
MVEVAIMSTTIVYESKQIGSTIFPEPPPIFSVFNTFYGKRASVFFSFYLLSLEQHYITKQNANPTKHTPIPSLLFLHERSSRAVTKQRETSPPPSLVSLIPIPLYLNRFSTSNPKKGHNIYLWCTLELFVMFWNVTLLNNNKKRDEDTSRI